MNKKIIFLAKTNLNRDGRILNQLKIIEEKFPATLIDFILLPDKPLKIELGSHVNVISLNTKFRNNKYLRVLTVLEFTLRTLYILFKKKPNILHAQDTAVVLPAIIFKLIKGKRIKVIYDDHEMPNLNESLEYKIFQKIEMKLIQKSDLTIFANKERMDYFKQNFKINSKCSYFLNLPYYENEKEDRNINLELEDKIKIIRTVKEEGNKIIIHQGSLEVERGREKLADFIQKAPPKIKILLIGISLEEYNKFVTEFRIDSTKMLYLGFIEYQYLNKIWEEADASVVMYLPTYMNNKLCAPNRFFIALKFNLPIIVNQDNPVLINFINTLKCGYLIENIKSSEDYNSIFEFKYDQKILDSLIESEKNKFAVNYEILLTT